MTDFLTLLLNAIFGDTLGPIIAALLELFNAAPV